MRKFTRIATLATCAALLTAPLMGAAQTPAVSERIRQVGTNLGFKESEVDRLAQGEIVSRDLKEDSKKELALAVAMVLEAPFAEVFDRLRKGAIEKRDKRILSHGVIPDGTVSADSFASLKFDSGELDKLLMVEAGSDFNLSEPEVEKLQGIAKANDSAPIAKQREAIAQGYREVLAQRLNAYRKGGVAGIAPFTRGGDEAQPGKELGLAVEEMKYVADGAPIFYAAFKNYPADSSPLVENQFTWQIQSIQDRPTVVLVHRMIEKQEDYAVAGRRAILRRPVLQLTPDHRGRLPVRRGHARLLHEPDLHGSGRGLRERHQAQGRAQDDAGRDREALRVDTGVLQRRADPRSFVPLQLQSVGPTAPLESSGQRASRGPPGRSLQQVEGQDGALEVAVRRVGRDRPYRAEGRSAIDQFDLLGVNAPDRESPSSSFS